MVPGSLSYQKIGKLSLGQLPSYFYKFIVKSVVDTAKTYFRQAR